MQKFKAAGITPLAVGGKDKWPAHFWWSKLVVRLAGQDGFNAAAQGEGAGLACPDFVKAGELFLQLSALDSVAGGLPGRLLWRRLGLFRRRQGRDAPDGRLGLRRHEGQLG